METFELAGSSGMDPGLGLGSPMQTGCGEEWVGLACEDEGSSPATKQDELRSHCSSRKLCFPHWMLFINVTVETLVVDVRNYVTVVLSWIRLNLTSEDLF